jgi:L-threonylcarbamoyladenylate synthase
MPEPLQPRTKRYKRSFQSKILNSWHIRLASLAIENGGVIAYPTEAVYGLGCSPWDGQAIQKLLQLKRRPPGKGLIVVAANIAQLHSLVSFDKISCMQSVLETWPGPVTWVLPTLKETPGWLSGEHAGIAVRVSAHPQLRQLCESCGPLVSTSANLANTRPARTVMDVRRYFQDALDYILPGQVGNQAGPSEIRHAESGQILRRGSAWPA